MSDSPWSDYLEGCAAYLDSGRSAIERGGQLPTDPNLSRQDCPLPEDQAWIVLGLVAEASKALDEPVGGRLGLFEACHALSSRVRQRRRHRGPLRTGRGNQPRLADVAQRNRAGRKLVTSA